MEMDTFAKIKKILDYGSGKAVILDYKADPEYVVMSWKEYERLFHAIEVLRKLPQHPITHSVPRPSTDQLTLNDLPL